ncbi:glycosyl transferase group 1 [Gloeocapsa sp. PCC 7428]|uniref:glycosyltransferase family 4 protein n=1 Tax=Gloeocapsa sp. PCC 7428 TaxID=1173026 RepID=UPI0002A6132B|nr:glycosyltransferase family 4 protein [Gloeocapsa sp. PCC 7428]AFZ32188.1 glycosyl transferase group 1 [Gloeocapsa sp. PCC 7428]
MKILLLSTYDFQGGAARAAYRLHQGLQSINVNSSMLVQNKYTDDETVIAPSTKLSKGFAKLKPNLDKLLLQLYPDCNRQFSPQWYPDAIAHKVSEINPDIINLHWVNAGYLKIETLAKFKKPIIWTLHDMWAFTGGCHYNQECDRYTKSCGACPQLKSFKEQDLSNWIWKRKANAWKNLNLTIITPSRWLAKCAESSSLFQHYPIEVIPNGIDIRTYKPVNRQVARNLLNLPQDKQLILFGAINATNDRRKGFHLLQQALKILSANYNDKIELVIFGASKSANTLALNLKSHYFGKLSDEISIALVYAAADVFVAPSIQDNLPNTIMEALACGTPSVAFNIGGMPDMIEHQKNGYLAQSIDGKDLAQGITWVLEDSERYRYLSNCARKKVEEKFTLEIQVKHYLNLFNKNYKKQNRYFYA